MGVLRSLVNRCRGQLLVAAALLVCAGNSRAFGPVASPLNPATYTSPSGRFRLEVDPTQRYGGGPARYRLTDGGREVWAGQRRFTFAEAAVTDDGTAAGYGYSEGVLGGGSFVVGILGPDGTVRLAEKTARTSSQFLHTAPNPLGAGVIVDPPNDRVVIRVYDEDLNRAAESWWGYRLSTARPLPRFAPKLLMPDAEPARAVVEARPVPGTPLTLLRWWRFDSRGRRGTRGTIFTLIDLNGAPMWRLELPTDHEPKEKEKEEEVAEGDDWQARIGPARPRRFTLRFWQERQSVEFEVQPEAGKWSVREIGRMPFVVVGPSTLKLEQLPRVVLEPLGTVVLRNPPSEKEAEIRDIRLFALADRGRIGILRIKANRDPAFVVVDPKGGTKTISLPTPPEEQGAGWCGCIWLGDERFLVVRSSHMPGMQGHGWWIDLRRGAAVPLPEPLPATKGVAPLPDGGFALLAWSRYDSSLSPLYGFDHTGKVRWQVAKGDPHREDLSDAESFCLAADGSIAVLQKNTVHRVSPAGKYLSRIPLAREAETFFPGIAAYRKGFAVFHTDAVVLLSDTGKLTGSLRKPASGWPVKLSPAAVAPAELLWVSDGSSLLGLNEQGVATRVVGRRPSEGRLDSVTTAKLGWDNRFYAVDARTRAIHVFDRRGVPIRVLKALPEDQLGLTLNARIEIDPAGRVYLGPLFNLEERLFSQGIRDLGFGADGKRLGPISLGGVSGDDWGFQPGTRQRWVWGEALTLVDAEGKPLRKHERRPDRNWLEPFGLQGAVGRDGTLAVLEGGLIGEPSGTAQASLSFYSAAGEPLKTLPVPLVGGSIWGVALDKDRIVLTAERTGLLMNRDGTGLRRFDLPVRPDINESVWRPFLSADRKELLLYDADRAFYRFRLPNSAPRRSG